MPIHAETEHLQLDVDVAQMSAEEQAEAAAVLRLAAERLSKTNESA
jgi:hypothetical protein